MCIILRPIREKETPLILATFVANADAGLSDSISVRENVAGNENINTFVPPLTIAKNNSIAIGSFVKKVRITKDNTPSMPLSDAHLEGFFFLTYPNA